MLVSHVNAHTPNGLDWLEMVVIPALRAGGGRATWEIEVHGNDGLSSDAENDDESEAEDQEEWRALSKENDDVDNEKDRESKVMDEGSSRALSGNLGPAVYIIHKNPKGSDAITEDDVEPPIPLKFHSY